MLIIVDNEKAIPIIGVKSVLATFKKVGEFANTDGGADKTFSLIKRDDFLSILSIYTLSLTTGERYSCKQYNFSLEVLSWFPKALDEFITPPIEGGLHAGAMTSVDEDVDGEMLCLQRTANGYSLVNWSRNSPLVKDDCFIPTDISFSSDFLYDQGFLASWKELGEKYEKGLI